MIMRKGQFFIIAALVLLTSIVLIRGMLDVYSSGEKSSSLSADYGEKKLENILDEFENAAGISSLGTSPGTSLVYSLSNFSYYIREREDARILWVSVFSNGTNGNYTATVGNYLQKNLYFNVSATSSSPDSFAFSLDDSENSSMQFSSQINGTINLTVSYSDEGFGVQDTFSFSVSNISSVAAFIDARILSSNGMYGSKRAYQIIMS